MVTQSCMCIFILPLIHSNTRHSDDIRLPPVRHQVRQNIGKRQCVNRTAAEYNRLPSHVRALNGEQGECLPVTGT